MMGRYPFMGRLQVESEADKKIAEDALRVTQTIQFAHSLVTPLSGGERQRVFLARALAQRPKVLLLDEPTANLDSRTGADILALMRRMQRERKTSFVFCSHDPQVLAAADDAVFIRDGRIEKLERRGTAATEAPA